MCVSVSASALNAAAVARLQYSLFYFNRLFASCIDNAPTSTILVERLAFLMEEITLTMYENVCRGLFESHKLVYSFMVCGMIHRLSGVIKG